MGEKTPEEGNYKTYEVSEMLGYREASYFSRLFRKYTKLSPAEYKKILKISKFIKIPAMYLAKGFSVTPTAGIR